MVRGAGTSITEHTAREWATAIGAVTVGEIDILGVVKTDGAMEAFKMRIEQFASFSPPYKLQNIIPTLENSNKLQLAAFEILVRGSAESA